MILSQLLTRSSFLSVASLLVTSLSPSPQLGPSPPASSLSDVAQSFRSTIAATLHDDMSLAGPLLRLAFHDATTGRPNGSIQYELERGDNRALQKPLQVVLAAMERNRLKRSSGYYNSDDDDDDDDTNGMLSVADAIALAGSEAVHGLGGPYIPIRLGRRDAPDADSAFYENNDNNDSHSNSNNNNNNNHINVKKDGSSVAFVVVEKQDKNPFSQDNLLHKSMPSPGLNSEGLRRYFHRLGLSQEEWVALCGCHSVGRHVTLLGMSKDCLKQLTRECLENAPVSVPFVTPSVDRFDNSYFRYLLKWYVRDVENGQVAFIPTDVALVVDADLRKIVTRYAHDERRYFRVFARAYQKLVEKGMLTQDRY